MLSPSTGYAALALALLAQARGKSVRVRYVADRCGIPGPYLAKIINLLARGGLVGTRRGSGGGVWLLAEPAEVTLRRLCELLDDPVLTRSCALGLPACRPEAGCVAADFCRARREEFARFLATTTVADFAARAFGSAEIPGDPIPAVARPRVIPSDGWKP